MHRQVRLVLVAAIAAGCNNWGGDPDPYDLDFDIPRSEDFAPSLSAYGLFEEPSAELRPTAGTFLYELSSELYTDHAYKQRLLRLPEGSTTIVENGTLAYPEGTIMAKTFYYPDDMGDDASPRRILETRLLIKTEGVWNVATYLWNESQTDATLLLDGTTTPVEWTDAQGRSKSTEYAVPHEGECVTCHQSEGVSTFIGPTLRNLNRMVTRDGESVNQLAHFVAEGVLVDPDWAARTTIPDYDDGSESLQNRARAYLDTNCAHCHQPDGWDETEEAELDLRYETPVDQTGLLGEFQDLERQLEEGEMPFLGTTLIDEAGVRLVLDYVSTLQGQSR